MVRNVSGERQGPARHLRWGCGILMIEDLLGPMERHMSIDASQLPPVEGWEMDSETSTSH